MGIPAPGEGRTCLVTGASSGIGADLARELAARGHGVALVARREDRLRALADELAASGVRVEVIPADLAELTARRALVGELADRGLAVEVLVNNAGITTQGTVAQSDPDRELALVRLDVEAVVDLCSLFVRGMVQRGRGAVLNVASTGAFQPIPGQAAYGGAKAFVLAYTRALSSELHGTGVTATTLCPGPVHTELVAAAGWDEEEAAGALPQVMWLPARDVAKAAIDGLDRGRPVVIPGAVNRLAAYAAYLTPRRVLLPLLASRHPSMRAARRDRR
jgi:short-subunit dehydrogenase